MAENDFAKQIEFLRRCKESVTYFIETCVKIQHPTIGILPFKLFKYQKNSLGKFRKHRFNVFRKCRQSGVSTETGAYALWVGMFFNHKKILITSKVDRDAKEFLARNIKFPYDNLPDWMKELFPITANDHEIEFKNGSVIRSLPAAPNALRSNASSLNIIDEAAFIDCMDEMWAAGYSCVDADSTYINVDGQTVLAGSLGDLNGDKWQDISCNIQSDNKREIADKFYLNGVVEIKEIITSLGYKIRCTPNHRLKDINYEWVYTKDINIGQPLALKAGSEESYHTTYLPIKPTFKHIVQPIDQNVMGRSDIVTPICVNCGTHKSIQYISYTRNISKNGKYLCNDCSTIKMSPEFDIPTILDEQLSELLGYYIGDGFVSKSRPKRLNLCYDPQDQDIYEHFEKYFKSLNLTPYKHHGNCDFLRINNARFIEWLEFIGGLGKTYAFDASIPQLILSANSKIKAAFLRGLFEADGWNYTFIDSNRPDKPRFSTGLSSISEKLISQVQILLLEFGIISKKRESKGGYANSGKSFRLILCDLDNIIKFQQLIGFISSRKNLFAHKFTSHKPIKYNIDDNGIFYDTVKSIKSGKCMTVDISVPSNNTYIANGFVSHNTLQHGGSVIVVSTPLGIGNWYWDTWTSAVDGTNNFNPIRINWWDMDWALEYVDPILKTPMRICPTDGIRPCTTKEDLEKYGEFWSPWLENEYKNLQRKGESYKFKQEILAEFVGSGGTVLSGSALKLMERTAKKHNDEHQIVTEPVEYIDSRTGEVEYLDLRGHDNNEGLWVWNEPITSTPNEFKNGSIVTKGIPGHTYILGADIATGRDNDFSAIEIFDVDTMEQVAEYMASVSTSIFVKIIDYLGRYYNNAVVCPDRTGIGSDVVEDLLTMGYPNVWRRVKYLPAGVEYGPYGFAINDSTKPSLNKALLEHIGENAGDGYLIKSSRLWKQAQIYIRHRNSRGLDTKKIGAQTGRGNYDDLVLAASLAFVTLDSIGAWDVRALAPARLKELPMFAPAQKTAMQIMESSNDPFALMPIIPRKDDSPEEAQEADLASFTRSLVAGPRREIPAVVTRKLYLP